MARSTEAAIAFTDQGLAGNRPKVSGHVLVLVPPNVVNPRKSCIFQYTIPARMNSAGNRKSEGCDNFVNTYVGGLYLSKYRNTVR